MLPFGKDVVCDEVGGGVKGVAARMAGAGGQEVDLWRGLGPSVMSGVVKLLLHSEWRPRHVPAHAARGRKYCHSKNI